MSPPPIACPACGGQNPAEAVFCANPVCHKALGGFRYIAEELDARSRPFERLGDRVTAFVGTPSFLVVHAIWFIVWVVLNATGIADFIVKTLGIGPSGA